MKLAGKIFLSVVSACVAAVAVNAFVSETPSPSSSTRLFSEATEGGLSRRQVGELTVAGLGLGVSFLGTRENKPTDYGLWGILPVGTYKTKKTMLKEIVPDTIWTLDQKFGILNVQVPIRMTVVKLKGGGLFVYNPVAATPECVGMLKDLVSKHGPIKHIVVGSVALEHKAYAGVMAQKFPSADVWLAPGQYSFPVNLPNPFLGYPASRTKIVPTKPEDAPKEWNDTFDFLTLGPFKSRDGAFSETVFRHKDSKTLIVTDTVLEVTDEVPEILESDPAPLLYHARDTVTSVVENTPETRKIGWRRVALFGLFFTPSAIEIKDADVAYNERRVDINPDFIGIYPWDWVRDDKASFDALKGGLLCAPILQTLILNRTPIQVLDFADSVSKWDIERIIPAHFKNDLKYNGKDYRAAFSFLEATGVPKGLPKPLEGDLAFLRESEEGLIDSGAIVPCPPLPGGKFTRDEILAQTVLKSLVL
mmetsp:Transcript_5481/g.13034  ORF Transcript_5481/g.13034 Transcript_5481/m.13034 type:complete len:477 (-) Transcript_5481:38-1468(-)